MFVSSWTWSCTPNPEGAHTWRSTSPWSRVAAVFGSSAGSRSLASAAPIVSIHMRASVEGAGRAPFKPDLSFEASASRNLRNGPGVVTCHGMHVVVTGATGFIGRAVVRRLQRDGTRVVALVRDVARGEALLGPDVRCVDDEGLAAGHRRRRRRREPRRRAGAPWPMDREASRANPAEPGPHDREDRHRDPCRGEPAARPRLGERRRFLRRATRGSVPRGPRTRNRLPRGGLRRVGGRCHRSGVVRRARRACPHRLRAGGRGGRARFARDAVPARRRRAHRSWESAGLLDPHRRRRGSDRAAARRPGALRSREPHDGDGSAARARIEARSTAPSAGRDPRARARAQDAVRRSIERHPRRAGRPRGCAAPSGVPAPVPAPRSDARGSARPLPHPRPRPRGRPRRSVPGGAPAPVGAPLGPRRRCAGPDRVRLVQPTREPPDGHASCERARAPDPTADRDARGRGHRVPSSRLPACARRGARMSLGWDPPRSFVDVATKGPFHCWWHEHRFEPTATGTHIRDRVLFSAPLGPIGRAAEAAWVRPTLQRLFLYRRNAVRQRFAR